MPQRPFPTLAEATRIWARIGLLSFGGPAGQIALMHRILVEEQKWLGERRFLHALKEQGERHQAAVVTVQGPTAPGVPRTWAVPAPRATAVFPVEGAS